MGKKQAGYKSDVLAVTGLNIGKALEGMILEPKQFSTGKVGFYASQKRNIKCGAVHYDFQAAVIVTGIQSEKRTLTDEEKAAVLQMAPLQASDLLKGHLADGREFSSGSVGFNVSTKATLDIAGTPKAFQVGVNIVAHNSKEFEAERPAKPKQAKDEATK